MWCLKFFAMFLMIGMVFLGRSNEAKAGTLNYTASISKTTNGNNITFTCSLNQTVDGQTTAYQWQEYSGSTWNNISGATGASYTVSTTGREGYQYRCNVTIGVPNTYSLMNECYKAFLHRQGVESEFQHWWVYLYSHTRDEYLDTVYQTLGFDNPVNEAAGVAMWVVFSDEYMAKYTNENLSYSTSVNMETQNGPKQLIVDCYRFLLQREPTDAEVEEWFDKYKNNNNGGSGHWLEYPDGNGELHRRYTYEGMAYVINGIAASPECKQKMAAAYYYNGDIGAFLYTERDVEDRVDPYYVTSSISSIPAPAIRAYVLTVKPNGGTWDGSTSDQTFTINQGATKIIAKPVRTGYTFTGWTLSGAGSTISGTTFTMGTADATLTANWTINQSTLKVNPNGGTWNGSTATQIFTQNYNTTKAIPVPTRIGYTFTGWTKSDSFNGSLSGTTGAATYRFGTTGGATDTITATWRINYYTVTLTAGTGIDAVTGAGSYAYGDTVNIAASLKVGYHWKNWTGSNQTNQMAYQFTMPAQNVTMTANAEANTYTIVFDPNDGGEQTHIDDITTSYDAQVTLPSGADAYKKYTQDGVNVTDQVLSGNLAWRNPVVQSEEDENEEALTETDEIGEADSEQVDETESQDKVMVQSESEEAASTVYSSVFMGWSLESGKDSLVPQWKAGETIDVSTLTECADVTDQNGASITLYAIWDDCPWIVATDLYYTLEQAQSGFITEDEILSHATASDREDGSPIEPGFHENGTSFSIPDYSPTDFTQFQHEGSCTENLTVVDSTGSVYKKRITVYVVDTTAVAVKPVGTTRFINEYYYNQPYEYGGLEDNSIWKTDPEYVAALQKVFENSRNNTPEETYYFTHQDILAMKEFVAQNGIGNSRSRDALSRFYDQFMAPNLH
jgi:uncharacterized repeat protein (TIGR02543 family)